MTSRTAGRHGEDLAARWLEEQGCAILDRNYSCRWGELDLVAEWTVGGEKLIAFTEVKLRRDGDFAPAYAAVTAGKRDRLRKAALCWLADRGRDDPARFDVIEIYTGAGKLRHIPNAFE